MKTIYIGKSAENDVIINDSFVSRRHLRITQQADGSYLLEDLGSTNGTFVNGNRVQSKILAPNDIVKIGETVLPWQNYFKPTTSAPFPTEKPIKSISIGRNPNNNFVISNPSVSQQHAILEVYPNDQLVLIDVGSTNGTFVENKKIQKSWVSAYSQVRFGNENVFINNILQNTQIPQVQNFQHFQSEQPAKETGKASFSPKKSIQSTKTKKNIPFEGIALVVLLILAIYGGAMFLKKNQEDKTANTEKIETEKTQNNKQNQEDDYLKEYDDEGNKIEKPQKNENKDEKEQKNFIEEKEQTNSTKLEDVVENAEQAVFRVDAFRDGFSQGFGTGFFVSETGIGVSNYHVFSPGNNWQIKLKNGKTYEVTRIIKQDEELDYVIFATNAQNVARLPIASQPPRKGQDIFVIGNPQGFELSVTKGIVSGIRDYSRYTGTASEGDSYIQIDAPISSGNSGGPVFNMNGEVIGIATMVVNATSGGVVQNLNLAVNIQKLNIP
jgi:S1-C subfamily serine protease